MRRTGLYMLLVMVILFAAGCANSKAAKQPDNPTVVVEKEKVTEKEVSLNIITTNKSLYNMVKDIVEKKHSVDYMFKNEADMWSFSYSEDSIGNISSKDLFIYSGVGLEPWIGDFNDKLSKSKLGIVNASRGIKPLALTNEIKYKETAVKDNPYYWLNVDYYKIALLNIKNSIQERDPKNRDIYEHAFSENLRYIEYYQKDLKDISDKLKEYTFLVDTDELDYFTKYNNFKVVKFNSMSKLTPEEKKAELDKLDKKAKESKNLIFLYSNPAQVTLNQQMISKYNLIPININVYAGDSNYLTLLVKNINNLKSILGK